MLSFIRKKNGGEKPAEQTPAEPPAPVAPPPPPFNQTPTRRRPGTTPGVQMLKDVWHIETAKKKKEMPPPGVSSDIYNVPKQRQMPPRNTGGH